MICLVKSVAGEQAILISVGGQGKSNAPGIVAFICLLFESTNGALPLHIKYTITIGKSISNDVAM